MLWILLFLPFVLAEWPPTYCDKAITRTKSYIQMTPLLAARKSSSCSCKEAWPVRNAALYIHFNRVSKESSVDNNSILGVKFRDAASELFDLVVHDNRLVVTGSFDGVFDCPGVFVNAPTWIRIRLDRWSNGTSVSVSHTAEDAFSACGRFQLSSRMPSLLTKIYARSETAMIQRVMSIQESAPDLLRSGVKASKHWAELDMLNTQLKSLSRNVKTNSEDVLATARMVQDLTDSQDLAELKAIMTHTSWRMYVGFGCIAILVLINVVHMIRKKRKERRHFL